jgi:FAD-dependent sensor of blue light
MHRLVYVSSAVELFSETELERLLKKSRRNNESAGLTGMLLYKDGNFMQCLEGPREAVQTLEARIRVDPRHRGMIVLLTEDDVQPEFKEWAMGFKKLDPDTALEVPGYSEFLDIPLTAERFQLKPSNSLKLLRSFRRNNR